MPQLLGLIFDLDGTLIDSAADLRQALNAVLSSHSRRALTLDEVKAATGDGLRVMLGRAFAASGDPLPPAIEAAVMQDFMTAYQNQKASREQLYPHVEATLNFYRTEGVKIGLCTNKLYAPTMRLLNDVGITELFDFIAGSDTFPVFKPDPGHVLGVAKGLKIPPRHCVMIGDSVNDIRAAQAASIPAIAVAHGYGKNIDDLGADAVISGFDELPEALRYLRFERVG